MEQNSCWIFVVTIFRHSLDMSSVLCYSILHTYLCVLCRANKKTEKDVDLCHVSWC